MTKSSVWDKTPTHQVWIHLLGLAGLYPSLEPGGTAGLWKTVIALPGTPYATNSNV
jgi:hypothetical protein